MSSTHHPDLGRALRRLIASADAAQEAIAARIGINATDLRCLELIAAEPAMTPTRLAELAGLTTGAITGVLDRLERDGYVRREADPADRRRLAVRAVPDRLDELATFFDGPLARAIDVTGSTTAEARRQLTAHVEALAGALGDEAERLRVEMRGGLLGDTYVAPSTDVVRARLTFASGAPRLSLGGAALGQQVRMVAETAATRLRLHPGETPGGELLRARFDGPPPDVRTTDGSVSMRYRRRLLDTRSRSADVALDPGRIWTVDVEGGVTDLEGDVRGVRLERLDVRGGANHLDLRLGRPEGTARIVFGGGSSRARFSRPSDVGVALRLRGGASDLRLDGRRLHGDDDLYVTSEDYAAAADRYEIEFSGGVSKLSIATD